MNPSVRTLGPFAQAITMDGLALRGPLRDEELPVIKDAGIALLEHSIVAIGPWSQIQSMGKPLADVPKNSVVMPGWIDAHTHLCFSGSRVSDYALRLSGSSYSEIAAQGGGILDTVRNTRRATQEELKKELIERTKWLLSLGITTCEVKSGYGLTIKDEIKILHAICDASNAQPIELISTCLAAHTKPDEFSSNTDYLRFLAEGLLPQLQRLRLTKRIDIFVDSMAFTPDEAFPYLLSAKEMGFSIVVHADQFSLGGSSLAIKIAAVSADHLEMTTPSEATLLSRSHVIPIVLPGSSLGLGVPFAPARMLLNHQLPVVIASDWNPGSAPMGNLLTQAALISASEHLTNAETFSAVTFRAARALELYDRGILKPSMRADLSIFPTNDYREILYSQGRLTPSFVFIKGKKVFS